MVSRGQPKLARIARGPWHAWFLPVLVSTDADGTIRLQNDVLFTYCRQGTLRTRTAR